MSAADLDRMMQAHGSRPFVLTDNGQYSYADIRDASLRFASILAGHGVGRSDTVAVLAGNSAAYVAAWFGIALCGGIAATLNNQLLAEGLCYTLRQSKAKAIVADREWIERAYHHLDDELRELPLIVHEGEQDFFRSLSNVAPAAPADNAPGDPFTILYTSGTTGLPKGVVNSYRAYFASGEAAAGILELAAEDRLMVFLPMFHVNPQMMGFMSAMRVGACIALRPRFSAGSFFDDAKRFGATGCTYVGTVFSILLNRYPDARRDHGLRFCFGGGVDAEAWQAIEERFGIVVHEAYGMTEMGGWTTSTTYADRRRGSCGKPRQDIELCVVDDGDNPVAPGVRGEIVGRPRQPDRMLLGYWDQPEKLVEATRNLWFHSGDLGSFDDDGYLYYHGRLKELIRRGGEMISPVEIEMRLMDMEGIADCAIVGVPDPIMDEEIKAVIVRQAEVTPQDVVNFLARHFPRYMLPRYVEFLEAIPKTASEKVRRGLLRENTPAVVDLKSPIFTEGGEQ